MKSDGEQAYTLHPNRNPSLNPKPKSATVRKFPKFLKNGRFGTVLRPNSVFQPTSVQVLHGNSGGYGPTKHSGSKDMCSFYITNFTKY